MNSSSNDKNSTTATNVETTSNTSPARKSINASSPMNRQFFDAPESPPCSPSRGDVFPKSKSNNFMDKGNKTEVLNINTKNQINKKITESSEEVKSTPVDNDKKQDHMSDLELPETSLSEDRYSSSIVNSVLNTASYLKAPVSWLGKAAAAATTRISLTPTMTEESKNLSIKEGKMPH
jgi:hypothetical protein